ncbi:MAG: DUF2927 domain-containing protein [Rhodobacteraceae bacterium]|nr:DUF2927 domain-containing protein [Paracoccaceae bacterium]TVR48201.1 MAG: DUF2927 domain-containing protein [Paracoccaceae bacterium]
MKGPAILALALALGACAAAPPPPVATRAPVDLAAQRPEISSRALFGAPNPFPPQRHNAQIAQDILELGFRLESGRDLPVFSRFEGPVGLRLQGQIPPLGVIETDRLIERMRREAGLDIRRGNAPSMITVEFVPRAPMRQLVPSAACFVVPNVESWAEFLAAPRSSDLDWTRVAQRETVLVIVPADTTVQEMRDCLHEEVAQAMGPLNDLFRIGETVMNDDNFQTALTGFDMLVLRVWNDPALRPGMTREQVAARLPAILARLNPRGQRAGPPLDPVPTPRAWTVAVETALGTPRRSRAHALAQDALGIAVRAGWRDERLALALFLSARFAPEGDGQRAVAALTQAAQLYGARAGGDVPRAHVELHLAAQALASGQTDLVLRLTDSAMPPARRSENGALLSSLMLLRAEALEQLDREAEAARLRRQAAPFAVFGFGSEAAAIDRRNEIAALVRRD